MAAIVTSAQHLLYIILSQIKIPNCKCLNLTYLFNLIIGYRYFSKRSSSHMNIIIVALKRFSFQTVSNREYLNFVFPLLPWRYKIFKWSPVLVLGLHKLVIMPTQRSVQFRREYIHVSFIQTSSPFFSENNQNLIVNRIAETDINRWK